VAALRAENEVVAFDRLGWRLTPRSLVGRTLGKRAILRGARQLVEVGARRKRGGNG
jgi:hypothetical protein